MQPQLSADDILLGNVTWNKTVQNSSMIHLDAMMKKLWSELAAKLTAEPATEVELWDFDEVTTTPSTKAVHDTRAEDLVRTN